jgi:anti-anti-sigma regulatory factor
MEITAVQHAGRIPVTVFQINGDIDSSTYQQIQAYIEQAVQNGTHDAVLDLSKVSYMGSAGIRMLTNLFNLLRGDLPQESDAAMKQGVRDGTFKSPHLKLAGTPPRVTEVMRVSGLDMMIASYASVSEAVASF